MHGGELRLEDYVVHLGTFFVASDHEGQPVTFELIEAEPLKTAYASPDEGRAPFALLFRTADTRAFEQRVVRLDHAAMGTIELFLSPVSRDAGGTRYEAVFN